MPRLEPDNFSIIGTITGPVVGTIRPQAADTQLSRAAPRATYYAGSPNLIVGNLCLAPAAWQLPT